MTATAPTTRRRIARLALVGVALTGLTVGALGTVAQASGPAELPPVDACVLVPEACTPGPKPFTPIVIDLSETDHVTPLEPTDTTPTVPTGEDPVLVDTATPDGDPMPCDPMPCPPEGDDSPCDIRVCTPIPETPEAPEVTTTVVAPPAELPDVVVDPPVVARPTFTG